MTAQITMRVDARLKMKLFPVPQSAGLARTFVAHHLNSLGAGEKVPDACQIISELVTNAIAETPDRSIWIYLGPNDAGQLVLEVWDSSRNPPVMRGDDLLAESGRGLVITEALSAGCGYRVLDDNSEGKIVWALLR
jgi:two-component sensor histidine kinase